MELEYDVIVVGGGHAGCEAASAAARMGSRTLLVTMDMNKFAQMSCNPAVGGVAKGQIVREIDALGGQMGIVTDRSTIQFRMLNRSKGPAMWSPRAQCDKYLFSQLWKKTLENTPNLYIWQDTVEKIDFQDQKIQGIFTRWGVHFKAKAVVLTAGTFLEGLMHVGSQQMSGGRSGDPASFGLSEQMKKAGFEVGRMKTGTPARLDARTIDFSRMKEQPGDEQPSKFSFLPEIPAVREQKSCYLVYTSSRVHDKLREGFDQSPLFNGTIQSIGPRYCPSIEDKLRTFADKDEHQLFLEPEGRNTTEYYLNGFSSSLPWQVQIEALRLIEGLENVHIFRPGYAIEYDYFPPTQLHHTLETKRIENLYFAGQVNGTTGYEEAAAQGLIAGMNAHLKINGQPSFVLGRDEAYIGVLIDDLVTKGVDEPYRMFTSRAEYRILLRQDNADARLTEKSYRSGLATEERYLATKTKLDKIQALQNHVRQLSVTPEQINPYLEERHTPVIRQGKKLVDIVLRNEVRLSDMKAILPEFGHFIQANNLSEEEIESVEIGIKYGGYIEREKMNAEKLLRLESIKIRPGFDYHSLGSLSIEARQKLSRIQPATIGQASRIPGVSPSDINVLLVYFGR